MSFESHNLTQSEYVNKALTFVGDKSRLEEARGRAKKAHEWAVKQAIKKGQTVSDRVLADYPKLRANIKPI